MYKRITAVLLALILIAAPATVFADNGFSSNPKAIDQAAKSVLMLQVFDVNNEMIATGSGFVAFNNRTLVTNYHVIDGADWMMANSDDGYQYMVTKVLTADEEKDIAICEFMSPTDLQPLEFNTTGELMRAESIVAIGSPIGITNTVSLGNISALYEDDGVSWIQFTAPISHGSSGGALFDNNGKVIGVTSASYIDTQNLNLAVHISEVEALYNSWDGVKSDFGEYMVTANIAPTATPIASLYTVLKYGDIGPDVTRLQKELIHLGYLNGKPSAQFEFKTQQAVRMFNILNLGKISLEADEEMQRLLFEGNPKPYLESTPTPKPKSTSTTKSYKALRKGDKGEEVKQLQSKLIELGYLDGTADGIFGNQTATAVAEFNNRNLGYSWDIATISTLEVLFDGNPKPFEDIGMTLTIKKGAQAEWTNLEGDKLKIRFQVTNTAKKKSIKAFELFVHARDTRGNEIYGKTVYNLNVHRGPTVKNVSPGQTGYSDYISLPNRSEISEVYCGIYQVTYTDGTTYTTPKQSIGYSWWKIK